MSTMPEPLSRAELEKILTQAQVPGIISDPRIQTPALFVLLGSTPAKAALELCRQMLSLSRRDRRRVALVYIDTDDVPAEVSTFSREHEGLFQEFFLRIAVPAGIDYATLPTHPMHTYIPSKTPQYFANGAGGIRNNGHVAAAFDQQKIVQTLEAALVAIEKLEAAPGEQRVREIQANLVAFLGGGTGSGILADVAVMVRQLLQTRQYQQRLNLFCLLPETIEGASTNDVSWRKSNATACLLELEALSLAAAAQGGPPSQHNGHSDPGGSAAHQRIYDKFLLNDVYSLTDDPVANEVYLIGRTSTGTADDTARIVGIDLFQRLTDASGVGYLEHSTWVNRRSLGATDERLLPTMFGTSCPMEVYFPARETAYTFARLSASYLLPALIGQQPPEVPATDAEKAQWRNEWREVAQLTSSVEGKPWAVRLPDEFSEAEFDGASETTFTVLWRDLQRRLAQTDAQIDDRLARKQHEENLAIISTPPAASGDGLTVLQRQIRHLHRLCQEYDTILDTLEKNPPEEVPSRPIELEGEYLRDPLIPLPAFIREPRWQQKAADICGEYNLILSSHPASSRYSKLKLLLTDLLRQARARLNEARQWFEVGDVTAQAEQLAIAARTSPAWRGRLDLPHPHIRHIFDLESLREAQTYQTLQAGRNLAVERLYLWATLPDARRQVALDDRQAFGARVAERFVGRCMAYLSRQSANVIYERQEDRAAGQGAQNQNADDLDAQGKGRLAGRVVEFFEQYYLHGTEEGGTGMPGFNRMNLFELFDRGRADDTRSPTGAYLFEHLANIRHLMQELVAFEETLWHDGPSRLDTTVYLSMRWEEGTGQREILDRAVKELGPLTPRSQTPAIANMRDPHRLQVSYGQHGISIATIPDFYRASRSAMADYLRHQGEWFGYQGPEAILSMPAPSSYGANKMPVHTCGELERLVCSPTALRYPAERPHARTYGPSLRGRVIREPTGPRPRPDWDEDESSNNGGRPPGRASGRPPAYVDPGGRDTDPRYYDQGDNEGGYGQRGYPSPGGPGGYSPPGQPDPPDSSFGPPRSPRPRFERDDLYRDE